MDKPTQIRVGIMTAPKIEWEQREHTFVLKNVRIGIGFHWDREEEQEFEGKLEIVERRLPVTGDGLQGKAEKLFTAVNIIDLEDYLTSVISSEMRAACPLELLKAHAVIARSWVLRALERPLHEGFDVCADDHCQRYEGIRRRNERAIQAVRETQGQVLLNGERLAASGEREICDCRYHKCCGGRTEQFETCWGDEHYPYLESVECPYCGKAQAHPQILASILNDYDQETRDFHDWQVEYTSHELGEIIRTKSGIDFGDIVDLIPLKRGVSGRIYELEIVGTKHRQVIGKELTIRQWLSPTCLYSSWFDVEKSFNLQLSTFNFQLTGHGWGHGVGLCQIGAAIMAAEGADYRTILSHYYKTAILSV